MNKENTESVWGVDDCITMIFADHPRPRWLKTSKNEAQAMARARKEWGSVHACWEYYLEKLGKHKRLDESGIVLGKGDIVLCDTTVSKDDVVNIDARGISVRRDFNGVQNAVITNVKSIWRKL